MVKDNQYDIVLVDDSPEDLMVLERLLSQRFPDASIGTIPGGEQCRDYIRSIAKKECCPKVVILDRDMPKYGGIDLAIRINHACPNVGTLIYSGDDKKLAEEEMKHFSIDGIFKKGEDVDELLEAIERLCA